MRHPSTRFNPNTPEWTNAALNSVSEWGYFDWDRYEKLAKKFNGGTFVDVGCLNSPLAFEMKKKFPESDIYALDHGDKLVAHFQAKAPDVKYLCRSCYSMPFEEDSLDYVVAGEILEHLDYPQQFINEAFRFLKKGGIFAFTTPNEETRRQQGGVLHVNMFDIEEMKEMLKNFLEVEVELYDCGAAVKFIMGWATK